MSNFLKTMTVLAMLCVSGFTQEVNLNVRPTAEELFSFATMGRPMLTNGFIRKAKAMSEYVSGIEEANISYEYMRAIRKEKIAITWFAESALVGGLGLGILLAAFEEQAFIVPASICYTLGLTGIIISGRAMQKATLRKDLLIRRVPVALKHVSVGSKAINATWVFGKTGNFLYTNDINPVSNF